MIPTQMKLMKNEDNKLICNDCGSVEHEIINKGMKFKARNPYGAVFYSSLIWLCNRCCKKKGFEVRS